MRLYSFTHEEKGAKVEPTANTTLKVFGAKGMDIEVHELAAALFPGC